MHNNTVLEDWIYLYYLNLDRKRGCWYIVLEDWIYLYYLNSYWACNKFNTFLRIEFICIIWTYDDLERRKACSWGLNLFVLFEHSCHIVDSLLSSWGLNLFVLFELVANGLPCFCRSWGLNLFVLFEPYWKFELQHWCSWGLNLFVLFELIIMKCVYSRVLEDWIYLYYLNTLPILLQKYSFLRIEFICIIWTDTVIHNAINSSWGLNLFVLFEHEAALKHGRTFLRIEFICIIWTVFYWR